MQRTLLSRSVLLLALAASSASAGERQSLIREVLLPSESSESATTVYVAGGVATVLRFEQAVDPAKTRLLGWEGRFEPLMASGRRVVIEPLQDIVAEDRFLLLVTLLDGTEVPFTVSSREGAVDHQVNLMPKEESTETIRTRLSEALQREHRFRVDAERYGQEKNSVDHSLAALLASGSIDQTPFRQSRKQRLECDGLVIDVVWFKGTRKAAVLLHGRVWTGGAQIVIRYYEAHPLDGDPVRICGVVRFGGNTLKKRPESKPGTAILEYPDASVFVVNAFR